MLVDATKCAPDCTACVVACAKENGLPDGRGPTAPQWIRKVELQDRRSGRTLAAPVMCQHCAHPPCVDVCPTGASFQRADGIVLVDRHTCIGCRYCMMACPVQGALVRARAGARPAAGGAARPRLRRVLHALRPPPRPRRHAGLRRGLRRRRPPGAAVRRPQRPDQRAGAAGRPRGLGAPLRADLQLAPAVRYQGL
ncbi:MAG: 4Fe-4S dicluster domain-containing protein [Betaproteobacteria bacterium]|nr:4Fe-4S dicluster domain-containing protein [Betaproteobacteria bacterium]